MLMTDNDFNYNRMMNEANRDLLCILESLALLNFALRMYSLKMARTLEGRKNQYSTVAAVANIDNRKDSCLSMGTGMEN